MAERQTQERHSDMPRYSKLLGKKTTALSFVKIYTANKEGRNNIVPLIRKEEQFVCKAYSAHYFTAEIPSSTHHPPACGQTPPITLLLEYLAPPITHQHVDRLRPRRSSDSPCDFHRTSRVRPAAGIGPEEHP